MKNVIRNLSLLLNVLLIAWIVYTWYRNKQEMSPSPLSKYVPSKDLAGFNSSVAAFLEKIESVESPQTKKITPEKARSLHQHYIQNKKDYNKDTTRAVFISLPKLFKTMAEKTKIGNTVDYESFFNSLANSSFYAYLGKYDENYTPLGNGKYEHPKDQTTIIIQLSDNNGLVEGYDIYDFGSLCPPNCPRPEQITPK